MISTIRARADFEALLLQQGGQNRGHTGAVPSYRSLFSLYLRHVRLMHTEIKDYHQSQQQGGTSSDAIRATQEMKSWKHNLDLLLLDYLLPSKSKGHGITTTTTSVDSRPDLAALPHYQKKHHHPMLLGNPPPLDDDHHRSIGARKDVLLHLDTLSYKGLMQPFYSSARFAVADKQYDQVHSRELLEQMGPIRLVLPFTSLLGAVQPPQASVSTAGENRRHKDSAQHVKTMSIQHEAVNTNLSQLRAYAGWLSKGFDGFSDKVNSTAEVVSTSNWLGLPPVSLLTFTQEADILAAVLNHQKKASLNKETRSVAVVAETSVATLLGSEDSRIIQLASFLKARNAVAAAKNSLAAQQAGGRSVSTSPTGQLVLGTRSQSLMQEAFRKRIQCQAPTRGFLNQNSTLSGHGNLEGEMEGTSTGSGANFSATAQRMAGDNAMSQGLQRGVKGQSRAIYSFLSKRTGHEGK